MNRGEKLAQAVFRFFPAFHKGLFNKADDNSILKSLSITKNQMRAIFTIQLEKKVTHSELGRMLELKKGSITSLVDSLVTKGFVSRVFDEKDRRKSFAILTESGTEMYKQIKAAATMFLERHFSTFNDTEVDDFIYHMSKLTQFFERLEKININC